MMIKKNKRGFTLVELLLVMAIIGILAGIVFITIGPARKRARVTAFKKSMQDITSAATLCVDMGGKIQDPSNTDTNSICSDGNMGDYPPVKTCRGGSGTINSTMKVAHGDADDFNITAVCPIESGNDGVKCNAFCDINGCKFGNGDAKDNDGCPKVKGSASDSASDSTPDSEE